MTFDDFYGAFPRKRNKGDARKAWAKIPPMLHDEIMAAVEAQKAHNWRGKDKQWIPYPGSWLRAEGWLDAIEEPSAPPPGKPRITANDGMPSRDAYDRAAGLK